MNYNDLIDSFLKEGFQIDGLFIHVFGDYNKFITRQLNQFITLEEKQLSLDNSPSKKYSFLAHLDPFQNQPNVVAVFPKKPCSLKLGKLGENEYNIFFEYLMPEVSIEVDIYPLLKLDIDK